jgi:hypothetical protein
VSDFARANDLKNLADNSDDPFEIHIVSFPNEEKFAEFQTDSKARESAFRRDKIIVRTQIINGYDIDYLSD